MAPKGKRMLHVINRGSDSESDSPDERHSDERTRRRHPTYEPPPISPYSPTSPLASLPLSSSGPVVTNTHTKSNFRLPNATPTSGSSNRSSPAPDTTPPPSTPGQSHPPTQLSVASANGGEVDERDERDHGHLKRPTVQPGQIFGHSQSSPYIHTRPTDNIRSFSSPANDRVRSLEGRVVIMATTDGDTMSKVDISGATESAFIRETIFAKLRIADEDQPGCQIFRTTLGEFPIGEALNDDDLFHVCSTLGDSSGSLKFLVQNRQPRGTEVFLPPVPVNSPAYALNGTLPRQEESPDPRAIQPRTRQHSHARDDGQSSTSGERISAGYDASVSGDDMPSLPNPHAPHRRLRSNDSNPRSPPPRRAMSPQMAMASLSSLPPPNHRQGSVTPTPPPPPPLPLYPEQSTRGSEADARERMLRDGESMRDRVGKEWEAQRQRDRARDQWQQDPSPPGPPGAVLDIQRSPQLLPFSGPQFPPQQSIYPAIPGTARPRQEPWAPTGARQPSGGGPRPMPQSSQSPPGSRGGGGGTPYNPYPPRPQTSQPQRSAYPGRLPVGAAPPHNPSRRGGQPVPSNWFNQGRQPDPIAPSPSPNSNGGGLPPPRLARGITSTKSMDNLPKVGQNQPSPTYRPPLQPAPGSDPNSNRNPHRPQHPQLQLNPSYRAPDPLSAPPPSPYNQLQLNPNFNSQYSGYPPPSPLSPGFNPSPRHGEFTPESLIPGGPGTRSNILPSNSLPYPSDPNDFYPTGVSPVLVPVARPADEQGNRGYGLRMASPPPDLRQHRPYPVDAPRSPRPWSDVDPGTGSSFTNQQNPPMRPRQSSAPSTTPPVLRSLPPQPNLLPMEATPPTSATASTAPTLPPIRQESGGWSDDGYGGVDRSPWNHNHQNQQQQQHHHRRPSDDAAIADDESEGTLRPSQREDLKNYMTNVAAAGSNHSHVGPPDASVHFATPPNRTPQSEESTLIPQRTAAYPPPPPPPLSVHPSYQRDPGDEDEGEDDYTDSEEEDDEDFWNGQGPPAALAGSGPSGPGAPLRRASKRKSTRGPPLTLKIADNPITVQPPSAVSEPRALNVPAHAEPPLASKDRLASSSGGTPVQRRSSFIKRNDQTWAFRPPAEDVIDRLNEFFPDHDLDKPVIETATSGSSSPTLATGPSAPPVPGSSNAASGAAASSAGGANVGMRRSHKKSIRHVAYERKRHMDRDSKLTTTSTVSRRHSTKFWGSRVEELTPAQERSGLPSSVPESPPAVNHNTRPIIKWVKGELIGKGTYGKVFLAMNITAGEMMAVKQVDRPQTISDMQDQRQVSVVEALKSESETLKNLDHPHIVQYLGFEETPEYFSIFLEYVPGGSVAGCLRKHGKFEENIVKSFTSQILDGLEYLHKSGILHRDMKADNILVDHMGICKISDFGISKRGEDIYNANDVMTQMQGSVFWMAPEVMHKEGYNAKIDIWSLGCIVMEMWAGRRPWNQEDILAVMYKLGHLKEQPPVPDDVVLTPLAEDFRMQCLAINPVERPTAAQLRSHPYLTLDPGWTFTGFR